MFIFYDESILSYVSSIRNFYGLDSSYKPNQKFSNLIKEKNPKKIFLILIDGMGANIVERYLPSDSFLRRHLMYKVQTVFPTTTTACLTAIQNGKAPNENAWIAWTEYIKEKDIYLVPFENKDYYTRESYDGFAQENIPVSTTADELNEKGIKAKTINPKFGDKSRRERLFPCNNVKSTIEELRDDLLACDKEDDLKYVFGYYESLDYIMHHNGPSDETSKKLLSHIDDVCKDLAEKISDDTMLVFVADHGQIDVDEIILLSGSKYEKYLTRKTYIEPRAVGFDIKEEYKEEFEKTFMEDYENDYILLTKKQVLDSKLFGYNESHPKFNGLLPDYIAVGKTNKLMYTEKPDTDFKGHHTGISDDEVYVPVIVYKK